MNELRRLQMTLFEILNVIDAFCKEHQIQYSLYAGTLLGAARHKGFIPWDDDLDICMERSEYNRFIAAWNKSPVPGYLLQNKDNSPNFTQSFTKIRKLHTTFLQYEWEAGAYHTGIFIDVFPLDRFPEGFIKQKRFFADSLCYQLFCREFVPPKGSVLQRVVAKMLLKAVRGERRITARENLLALITKEHNRNLPVVAIETLGSLHARYPAALLESYTELPFEGSSFPCFSLWDQYLKIKFGNYMLLPPETERAWKHHPIILNFEHEYDEIVKKQSINGTFEKAAVRGKP